MEKQRPAAFLEGGEAYHTEASPAAARAGGRVAWEADCKDSPDIYFMEFLLICELVTFFSLLLALVYCHRAHHRSAIGKWRHF